MSTISLKKLLKPRGNLHQVLTDLLSPFADSFGIYDPDGQLLFGKHDASAGERLPVMYEDQALGWVAVKEASPVRAAALMDLLTYVASQENEKKSLAAELVDRYRELSLLYHYSEHLAAAPEPEAMERSAIEETLRMIRAASGLMLLKTKNGAFEQVALDDQPRQLITPCCLIERVLTTGKAELANAVSAGEYFVDATDETISLLCAPLKTEKNMLGAIVLVDSGTRTFTAGELKLLNTIAMQTGPVIEISRLYQIAVEKARIERELQMARQVQESLLPQGMPQLAGWSFAHRWRPARQVSGDFYDVIPEEPGRLGLVIADVTDKGMPASLFMVFVRSALRASIQRSGSPAESITYANESVCRDSHQGLFATLVYARLQVESGRLEYVNAGHNPPLFYHAQSGELQVFRRTGLPVGVEEDAEYDFESIQLDPGDFVLFYTDGITEAIDPKQEEFGLERLMEKAYDLRNCQAEHILDGLERELAEYTADAPAFDDVTLLVIKRT